MRIIAIALVTLAILFFSYQSRSHYQLRYNSWPDRLLHPLDTRLRYQVADVDPRFGTLLDFCAVVERCHACGIRVIIDLVVNHVSSQHPWFQDAWNNPASRYRDYFLFSQQPNNWQSFFSGSAWCVEPDTGQYYYHKFAPQQVDLNWQNPQVEQEIFRVIDFWKARGVDGFRFEIGRAHV